MRGLGDNCGVCDEVVVVVVSGWVVRWGTGWEEGRRGKVLCWELRWPSHFL